MKNHNQMIMLAMLPAIAVMQANNAMADYPTASPVVQALPPLVKTPIVDKCSLAAILPLQKGVAQSEKLKLAKIYKDHKEETAYLCKSFGASHMLAMAIAEIRTGYNPFKACNYNKKLFDNQSVNRPGLNLQNCDLSKITLDGTNMSKWDLRGANLSGSNLRKLPARWSKWFLTGTKNANMAGIDLSWAKGSAQIFDYMSFGKSSFFAAEFNGLVVRGSTGGVDFGFSTLKNLGIVDSKMSWPLEDSTTYKSSLIGADVQRFSFKSSDLSSLDLSGGVMRNGIVTGCNLAGVDWNLLNAAGTIKLVGNISAFTDRSWDSVVDNTINF